MKRLFLLMVAAMAVADDLPPSCYKPVYCNSKLLHYVQTRKIFNDSKTFVDLQMRTDENTTLTAFDKLMNETDNEPTVEDMESFLDKYFDDTGELEAWTPTDYNEKPAFLATISDENLRRFAKDINDIWPILGKKVKSIVFEKPEQFSFIPVPNGFIIPGGRFTELYYWDTYWIVEGLLISGMDTTAKGVIENLIELLKKIGHIPNGSRWYYQERSQPPMLTAMVALYVKYTKDTQFLEDNIKILEKEMSYWMDTQIVSFSKDDRVYTLLRYYAPSAGPRPESYSEDYNNAQYMARSNDQNEFYSDIKSAAESGWDFSSRWFITEEGDNNGNLTDIHTRSIIPVDLNSIFANALENIALFHGLLKNPRRAAHWAFIAEQWRNSIQAVFWNDEDQIWYDYDILNQKHRKYFYPTNVAPLWMNVVDKKHVKKNAPGILSYLHRSRGIDFPGGVPASMISTGEQWDFPNAWPPLVSIIINGIEALGTDEGNKMAFKVAQTWVRACYEGFEKSKQMFEKYDAQTPGSYGGGGEYTVQNGFGWSNGVVLELLSKYGRTMTAYDSLDTPSST